MAVAYIAFGSNLGERYKNIRDAIKALKAHPSIKVKKISSIMETKPEGGPPQPKFLNCVLEMQTGLSPHGLLKFLQKIESDLGRKRTVKNGPRTIDLDIIFYDDKVINKPDLVIPHPKWRQRQFVLKPLCEIAPIAVIASRTLRSLAMTKSLL